MRYEVQPRTVRTEMKVLGDSAAIEVQFQCSFILLPGSTSCTILILGLGHPCVLSIPERIIQDTMRHSASSDNTKFKRRRRTQRMMQHPDSSHTVSRPPDPAQIPPGVLPVSQRIRFYMVSSRLRSYSGFRRYGHHPRPSEAGGRGAEGTPWSEGTQQLRACQPTPARSSSQQYRSSKGSVAGDILVLVLVRVVTSLLPGDIWPPRGRTRQPPDDAPRANTELNHTRTVPVRSR